jgi:23S rRNA (cytidine1920-2'-O)/16S rRNA (cytidine1409-2'-O)-methyltransferase
MGKGIRLDLAIVERKLCESRTEAQELIKKGVVFVDGICAIKATKQVTEANIIDVRGKREFVSRGGDKLTGILEDVHHSQEKIEHAVRGMYALDVGSSTGGFTDCLLKCGAKHVDAVDVGTSQLHPSLRNDTRVSVHENQDIRTFNPTHVYDIIVTDVSFIPLSDILETLVALGTEGRTKYYLLVKPQFEVGKGNTKKGIVKDETLIQKVLAISKDKAITLGLKNTHIFPCHIQGGDGNQEYFLYGEK